RGREGLPVLWYAARAHRRRCVRASRLPPGLFVCSRSRTTNLSLSALRTARRRRSGRATAATARADCPRHGGGWAVSERDRIQVLRSSSPVPAGTHPAPAGLGSLTLDAVRPHDTLRRAADTALRSDVPPCEGLVRLARRRYAHHAAQPASHGLCLGL